MQKEKIRKIEKKIIISILFLVSSFLLSALIYPFISKYLEMSSLLLLFKNYLFVVYLLYFFFIFSIFYLVFELLSYFLNEKKVIIAFVLITFFSMLGLLWFIGMTDESGSFIIYLLIMTSLLLAPLLSFQQLIKNVKTRILMTATYLVIYITLYILFS